MECANGVQQITMPPRSPEPEQHSHLPKTRKKTQTNSTAKRFALATMKADVLTLPQQKEKLLSTAQGLKSSALPAMLMSLIKCHHFLNQAPII